MSSRIPNTQNSLGQQAQFDQEALARSMTGFASACSEVGAFSISCEVRSINSRFLDVFVRAPKELAAFEGGIRQEVGKCCFRGRVEVTISFALKEGVSPTFDLDIARFQAFYNGAEKILAPQGLWDDEARRKFALDCLSRKDIIHERANPLSQFLEPSGEFAEALLSMVREALEGLDSVRSVEGEALCSDIKLRNGMLAQYAEQVRAIHHGQSERYRSELTKRCQQLVESATIPAGALSEERIMGEVALLVERSDITEELVRLQSHLEQIESSLVVRPAGRRLDFLLQECLREVNTIGSKVQDAKAQHLVVEMKVEIEKMKEQVQNIE